jgi:drug/metabolite transporter (DMT)-like permease
MYKKGKLLFSILVILFGVFMFVYGEYDDSPGGQLLGLLTVIAGVVGIVRRKA